jgi:hypothetical protein
VGQPFDFVIRRDGMLHGFACWFTVDFESGKMRFSMDKPDEESGATTSTGGKSSDKKDDEKKHDDNDDDEKKLSDEDKARLDRKLFF